MNGQSDWGGLDALALMANIFQVLNYAENLEQTSNGELLKAFDVQTQIILDRLESKLDKILENQAKMMGGNVNGLQKDA